jgi:hypothetical protein
MVARVWSTFFLAVKGDASLEKGPVGHIVHDCMLSEMLARMNLAFH